MLTGRQRGQKIRWRGRTPPTPHRARRAGGRGFRNFHCVTADGQARATQRESLPPAPRQGAPRARPARPPALPPARRPAPAANSRLRFKLTGEKTLHFICRARPGQAPDLHHESLSAFGAQHHRLLRRPGVHTNCKPGDERQTGKWGKTDWPPPSSRPPARGARRRPEPVRTPEPRRYQHSTPLRPAAGPPRPL